jgi:predicted phosphoribosyltransferase
VHSVADKVITCATGEPPFAVADYYRHWYDVSDDEVVKALDKWRSEQLMKTG